MADNTNGQPPVGPDQKPASATSGFLSSTAGKLVVGGVLLFLVLIAVGALAFFFLFGSAAQKVAPSSSTTATAPSNPATEGIVPTDPPEQPLDETFTFRNVFAPTVTPAQSSTDADSGSGGSSGDTSPTASGATDTLILKSIHTDSGERVATFEWNGAVYECREGDQVAQSPWEVVTIYSDSVVMLYGDSRITLTVGQGYTGSWDK
ncbi:MAG: hypothetical protein HGB10_04650 [Coriobacteriia bacterium]|nr:hypothetical protein [Coriobacteriia bacterium]